jgi:hypothetical protein
MRDKEWSVRDSRFAFTLTVVLHRDRHVVGFALDDDPRPFRIGFVLHGTLNHDDRSPRIAAMLRANFLGQLAGLTADETGRAFPVARRLQVVGQL